MPAKMADLRKALGLRGPCSLAELRAFGSFPAGREVSEPGPLFPRIEKKDEAGGATSRLPAAKPDAVHPAAVPPAADAAEGLITYDDFARVQFRTAKVLEAEKVPGADKLLRLQILVGEEKRQIVAGIALHYKPEDVIGKTVVVVANLKPARIRGIESNGMLLAASKGEKLRLVTVDGELSSGATVK